MTTSALLILVEGGSAGLINISNVEPRRDVKGAIMDMHDGNMHIGDDGTFYWYAAGYGGCLERNSTTGCAGGFHGCGFFNNHSVNLFTSKDLLAWTPHGNVLPESNRVDAILFSPKVLFNRRTATYVLWYNFVPHYSYAVATSKSPYGPFTTVNRTAGSSFRFGFPANSDIGDFSVWADDDGAGYMLYSSHAHCQVEELTDDYLSSTWATTSRSSPVFPHGNEAPALFKREGRWFALVSESCCYCEAGGKVHAYSAEKPLGPWTYLGEIAAGPNPLPPISPQIATAAQQTNVFPFQGRDGGVHFMWQGDRWQSAPDRLKSHDYTYWAPLSFTTAGAIERLKWRDWFTISLPGHGGGAQGVPVPT